MLFADTPSKGRSMNRIACALSATMMLAFATSAFADPVVTVDTTTGQPLQDMIHASKSNTVNNQIEVYGSTAQGAQSQNVLFTGGSTANVAVTELSAMTTSAGDKINIGANSGGFAFINNSGTGTNNFYDLIINPDQLFTDMK